MGGFGSGRPSCSGRHRVESCRSIDVNRLLKAGCLVPGWRGGWEWRRDGERVAHISMRAEEGCLVISYNYRRGGGEWQSAEEPIVIEEVPCSFGGTRPYFICPGVVNGISCGRRVAKLCAAGRYFLCRHCYRLAYASQSEGKLDRTLRKANKIRMRLGGEPGMLSPFPPRPKGMWRRTYESLRVRVTAAEILADRAFAVRAAGLLGATAKSKCKRSFRR